MLPAHFIDFFISEAEGPHTEIILKKNITQASFQHIHIDKIVVHPVCNQGERRLQIRLHMFQTKQQQLIQLLEKIGKQLVIKKYSLPKVPK